MDIWPDQNPLFDNEPQFPTTRFQGSKLKLVDWIWDAIKDLDFETALDAFGGTGSVAFMLKQHGKQVIYNDILKFNWYIGLGLIENDFEKLTDGDLQFLLSESPGWQYPTFIHDTFKDIYFTDEENSWIDRVMAKIETFNSPYKKALSYFALFQACIIKRPFNLFHRRNLYIRQSNVHRNFGNKTTWDTPFEIHFKNFANEVNQAVFSNGCPNRALNQDALTIEGQYDLVYIDTPYISGKGMGTDYLSFYHFLEGLANYPEWQERIDFHSKNRRFYRQDSPWNDKNKIHGAFEDLFDHFRDSILVVSYRSDGIPGIGELERMLKRYKSRIIEVKRKNYQYVLSNHHSEEVLLIGV
jgi:adenine-specific DNA-methyltransferase